MSGGLMQLVAYGAQDVYLTGNPQITFFKIVYKRHTNFAVEAIEQIVNGDFSFGNNLSSTIAKNGDLITKMYIKCDVSLTGTDGNFAWINKLGHALIEEVELLIGGNRIDKQYSEWLNIWYELARNVSQDKGYDMMIGNNSDMTELSTDSKSATLYIPLKFYFNKFNGLAIPLISLQYHDVRVDFKLRSSDQLIIKESKAVVSASISNISLLVNFVFLDSVERKRFASSQHEYLIEQIQVSNNEKVNLEENIYKLNFSHPCKSLYWMVQNGNFISGKSFLGYTPESKYIYRSGYADLNLDLIKYCSVRYVLSQVYSLDGKVKLSLNGSGVESVSSVVSTVETVYNHHSITLGDVVIKANYNSLTNIDNVNNTAECDSNNIDNWELVTGMSIDNISTPVDELMSGFTRTSDSLNIGNSDFDIIVYQWNNFGKYLDYSYNPVLSSLLKLNGHERFAEQSGEFFNYLQPYETHKSTPKDGINLFSFALNPLEHQPSGTCNFSRIDNTSLSIKFDSDIINVSGTKLVIFVLNYNILRVMNGLAGISYSN
jgi:hypothetical protein